MAELVFDCIGAQADRYAVVPTFSLRLRISETSGEPVAAIALRCQLRIEPARRRYSAAEAERLHDLFGDTDRWADTLKPLQFTMVSLMVPGFTGSTEVDVPITASYDLEVAATRYFAGLDDGTVPLLLLFSGTLFGTVDGRAPGAAGAVEQGGAVPAAGQRLARGDRRPFPQQRLDQDEPADPGRAAALQDQARPADLGGGPDRAASPGRRHGRRRRHGAVMTLDPAHVEHARKVADAVLYEGYLLYPYRQTAQKNQARFQFGVLMPPAYLAADDSERSASQTECLAECADDARVEICVRYLQLRRRTVQAGTPEGGLADTGRLRHGGAEYTPWDEAAECEQWFSVPVADLLGPGTQLAFGSPSGLEAQKLADPDGAVAG